MSHGTEILCGSIVATEFSKRLSRKLLEAITWIICHDKLTASSRVKRSAMRPRRRSVQFNWNIQQIQGLAWEKRTIGTSGTRRITVLVRIIEAIEVPVATTLLQRSISRRAPVQLVAVENDVVESMAACPDTFTTREVAVQSIWTSKVVPRPQEFNSRGMRRYSPAATSAIGAPKHFAKVLTKRR